VIEGVTRKIFLVFLLPYALEPTPEKRRKISSASDSWLNSVLRPFCIPSPNSDFVGMSILGGQYDFIVAWVGICAGFGNDIFLVISPIPNFIFASSIQNNIMPILSFDRVVKESIGESVIVSDGGNNG
jgi:hypothetical protein